jgi:hypothetical protein
MESPSIGHIGQFLILTKPSGRTLSLPLEGVVRAEVIRTIRGDEVMLRIGEETVRAKTELPLSKGDVITLKVLDFDKDVRLRLLSIEPKEMAAVGKMGKEQPPEDLLAIPEKILKMLSSFSNTSITHRDIRILNDMCRSLPGELQAQFPELQALAEALPGIAHLTARALKAAFENSGIFLETKLKIVAGHAGEESMLPQSETDHNAFHMKGQEGISANKMPLQADKKSLSTHMGGEIVDDLKGHLLKVREILKDAHAVGLLKLSGMRPEQMREVIDKLIRNIEFFQMTSKIHDMLYAYLPVSWQELKDGELIFKRSRNDLNTGATYSCTINLDLEYTGKMSVSLTMHDRSLYISFRVEKQEMCELLNSHKDLLEKKCADAGISLRAVNFITEPVVFGKPKAEGLHIKA